MAEQAEAIKQCVGCKKPVKKLRRFYRNGQYYCSENCFRKTKKGAASGSEK